jgi:hypothetical protein
MTADTSIMNRATIKISIPHHHDTIFCEDNHFSLLLQGNAIGGLLHASNNSCSDEDIAVLQAQFGGCGFIKGLFDTIL